MIGLLVAIGIETIPQSCIDFYFSGYQKSHQNPCYTLWTLGPERLFSIVNIFLNAQINSNWERWDSDNFKTQLRFCRLLTTNLHFLIHHPPWRFFGKTGDFWECHFDKNSLLCLLLWGSFHTLALTVFPNHAEKGHHF